MINSFSQILLKAVIALEQLVRKISISEVYANDLGNIVPTNPPMAGLLPPSPEEQIRNYLFYVAIPVVVVVLLLFFVVRALIRFAKRAKSSKKNK